MGGGEGGDGDGSASSSKIDVSVKTWGGGSSSWNLREELAQPTTWSPLTCSGGGGCACGSANGSSEEGVSPGPVPIPFPPSFQSQPANWRNQQTGWVSQARVRDSRPSEEQAAPRGSSLPSGESPVPWYYEGEAHPGMASTGRCHQLLVISRQIGRAAKQRDGVSMSRPRARIPRPRLWAPRRVRLPPFGRALKPGGEILLAPSLSSAAVISRYTDLLARMLDEASMPCLRTGEDIEPTPPSLRRVNRPLDGSPERAHLRKSLEPPPLRLRRWAR